MERLDDICESTEIVASEDCLSTGIEGESVVLHTTRGEYFGFNEVGSHVWKEIQEPRTVREVCESVTSNYDVDYDRCLGDITALLSELVEGDLARITE